MTLGNRCQNLSFITIHSIEVTSASLPRFPVLELKSGWAIFRKIERDEG